ncbi:hypothetical protein P3X46_032329 [Hevea brasiliensis]|uniref:DUF4283 domain-containing protein n=1 Tax=Hevea brasiliensis TaxID=3981 RepID=A0ABQ9KFN3_HEVBR|nr:hypothetical protein P3X46_032329 [Hevea brasiliensis]
MCLMHYFITDCVINFNAMKHTVATLWHLGKGICIKELGSSLFMFQFFHEVDVSRVVDLSPWSFDQHLLLFKRLNSNEQPTNVQLFHTLMWVQLHALPLGFMLERMASTIGNFIGGFVEADSSNYFSISRSYMRIRVCIDVQLALKRHLKINKAGRDWVWVTFKYECLSTFCFICGKLGHFERFV